MTGVKKKTQGQSLLQIYCPMREANTVPLNRNKWRITFSLNKSIFYSHYHKEYEWHQLPTDGKEDLDEAKQYTK